MKSTKKIYFASLGNCNQKCLFCARGGDEPKIKLLNTSQSKKILEKKAKEGYDEIYFDGGEPTLRKDLKELVGFAVGLGFKKINILTNGVSLADRGLVKKLLPASFSVSLHSHKKNISEKITGTKNSFDKTIKGIENLLSCECKDVSLYHIISRYNYEYLPDFVKFVDKNFPKIKNITFSFIYPAGAALKNKDIFPKLSKVEPYLKEALDLCKKKKINFSLSTCGTVPLCFLSEYEDVLLDQQELDQPENVGLVDANQNTRYQLASKKFHKKTKIKSSVCEKCFFDDRCGGLWKDYVSIYGADELKPVVSRKKTETENKGEVFLAVTGWSCNNNCVFCTTVSDRNINRSTKEILEDVKQAYKDGYRIIEFIGGEVSIRSDFFNLVSGAKKIGFDDIRLTTNGRLFGYDYFLKKGVDEGLRVINFSLHGHKKVLHDGMTRTPGSFKQCLSGVKNAIKNPKVKVIINTVVSKMNYKHLLEMADFLRDLGVGEWHLLELLPDGRGTSAYNNIAVGYKDLSLGFKKISEFSKHFDKVDIFDFPFCIFEPEVFDIKNITFFTPQNRYEDINQKGFGPERVSKSKTKKGYIYEDKYKIKPKVCKSCVYFDKCGGLAKPYFKKKGDKEIKELKHG